MARIEFEGIEPLDQATNGQKKVFRFLYEVDLLGKDFFGWLWIQPSESPSWAISVFKKNKHCVGYEPYLLEVFIGI